jgi:hypothetical protein
MTCPDTLDAARLASFLDGQAVVLLDESTRARSLEVTSSASPVVAIAPRLQTASPVMTSSPSPC